MTVKARPEAGRGWPTHARFWLGWGCSHVTDLVRRTKLDSTWGWPSRTQHGAGCPTHGSFTGGLLRTLPGMFIGHNEIVAMRSGCGAASDIRPMASAAQFSCMRLGKRSFAIRKIS
jgi:hypothetical protein